jgi:hypothetical protein
LTVIHIRSSAEQGDLNGQCAITNFSVSESLEFGMIRFKISDRLVGNAIEFFGVFITKTQSTGHMHQFGLSFVSKLFADEFIFK